MCWHWAAEPPFPASRILPPPASAAVHPSAIRSSVGPDSAASRAKSPRASSAARTSAPEIGSASDIASLLLLAGRTRRARLARRRAQERPGVGVRLGVVPQLARVHGFGSRVRTVPRFPCPLPRPPRPFGLGLRRGPEGAGHERRPRRG